MIKDVITDFMQNKNVVMFTMTLVFMTGILSYFNNNEILYAALITILAIFFVFKNYLPLKYVLFLVIIFYLGFFRTSYVIHSSDDLMSYNNSQVTLKGQIVSVPNSGTFGKTKFFFKVFQEGDNKIEGKTFVSVTSNNDDILKFQIGDYYEISGKIKIPFNAGNPNQFDYGKYLRNYDTYTVFYASDNDCKVINRELSIKYKFFKYLNNLRDKIIDVHSNYIKSPNLEILGGIVFGDDAIQPPDEIKSSFTNSGLLHILAASGMNVAFIYGFWVFLMGRLRLPFKFTIVSGMSLIVLYTMMTGLGASVIRAALMLLLILAGKLIDRDSHSVSLLAFVAFVMLIYNPSFINDVGFQLSFIVTFGLLTTANVIFEKYQSSKILTIVLGFFLIPIVAQIWVAPIQMFYFNTISTYSILANIFSVPFLTIVSFGGFLSSIIAIFTPFTDKICFILDFILNYTLHAIVYISNFFSNLPYAQITTTHPSVLQIIVYYAIILFFTLSVKKGLSKQLIIIMMSLMTVLLVSTINLANKTLDIIAFDVQNADCFLVKTPENKYFVIDTGRAGYNGSKAQANSNIIKYLKDKGIKHIEGLIITHFDNDHSGGAVDIMKSFSVKNVYVNSFNNKSYTSFNIYKEIKEDNINSKIPKDIIYEEPDLNIKTYIADKKSDNEQSIITLLSYKNFDMLFMGDAGIEAYNDIKHKLKSDIEVLKVGHHGGSNVVNKEMINNLNIKVSIISTGPNNFGHPNKGTLDTLKNTEILRTDRHNSIKISSNGLEYKIFQYSKEKKKFVFLSNLNTK